MNSIVARFVLSLFLRYHSALANSLLHDFIFSFLSAINAFVQDSGICSSSSSSCSLCTRDVSMVVLFFLSERMTRRTKRQIYTYARRYSRCVDSRKFLIRTFVQMKSFAKKSVGPDDEERTRSDFARVTTTKQGMGDKRYLFILHLAKVEKSRRSLLFVRRSNNPRHLSCWCQRRFPSKIIW